MKIIILLFKLFLFQLTNSLSRKRKSEKCEIKFENQQVKVKINEEKAFDKFLDKEIEINCSNLQDVKQLTFPSIKQISIIRIINNTGIERVDLSKLTKVKKVLIETNKYSNLEIVFPSKSEMKYVFFRKNTFYISELNATPIYQDQDKDNSISIINFGKQIKLSNYRNIGIIHLNDNNEMTSLEVKNLFFINELAVRDNEKLEKLSVLTDTITKLIFENNKTINTIDFKHKTSIYELIMKGIKSKIVLSNIEEVKTLITDNKETVKNISYNSIEKSIKQISTAKKVEN